MPRRKTVKSLKSMCVDNICKNMESFWYEKYWKDIYSSPERLKSEVGPFEYLPGCLMNEIVKKLNEKRDVRENIMTSLITSTLSKFKVPVYRSKGSTAFDLLSLKCQYSLTELTLSHCRFEKEMLMKVLKSLRNLEVLNLDRSGVDDDVTAVVGSHCDKLRKLNLHGCRSVTDKGMEYLFVDGSTVDGVHSYGKCKQLASLDIIRTKVSDYGIETVLRNAPKLQNLVHCNVLYVLDGMHSNDLEANTPLVQYSLTSLRAGYRTKRRFQISFSHSLSIAVQVCPRITDVTLDFKRNVEEIDVLHPLCQLKKLKSLRIRCYGCEEPDFFFSEVVPVLSVSGQSIVKLCLKRFRMLDVGIIGECCPLLEYIHLDIFDEYGVPRKQCRNETFAPSATNRKSFTFLKLLDVAMDDSDSGIWGRYDLTPSQWKGILSSRHLESIAIKESSTLTDRLLSEVLKAGQTFPKLRKLDLLKCPNITAGFVQTFLDLQNPLEEIHIWSCKRITESDFDSFKSFFKLNCLDVVMEFNGYYNNPLLWIL